MGYVSFLEGIPCLFCKELRNSISRQPLQFHQHHPESHVTVVELVDDVEEVVVDVLVVLVEVLDVDVAVVLETEVVLELLLVVEVAVVLVLVEDTEVLLLVTLVVLVTFTTNHNLFLQNGKKGGLRG